MTGKEIKWTAPEFEYYHKGSNWYWVSGIAAIVLVAIAFWQRNFLFAVFIALAEIVLVTWAGKTPRYVDFKLDKNGLDIHGHTFYSYETLDGFAMKEMDEETGELVLRKKGRLSQYTKIIVPASLIAEIKKFLKNFLTEIEYEESLMDHLSRLLRF